MKKTIQQQIQEMKTELAVNSSDLVEEAENLAKRLREMADQLEAAAGNGAEAVDTLFCEKVFVSNHVDWQHSRLYLSMWMVHKRLRERSEMLEYQIDLYEEEADQLEQEKEERAAAAIHAGLKGEDEDEWVIWQWANGDWHEIPGNWPTSEDALSEVKDLRDKNPETPFRFSKRNHVWG